TAVLSCDTALLCAQTLFMPDASSSSKVRSQALAWLVRQRSGRFTASDRAEFERWLNQNPEHAQVFAALRNAWEKLPRPKAELVAARRKRAHRNNFYRYTTAAVLGLLFVAVEFSSHEGWPILEQTGYRTAKGERRRLSMADGSEIELNTGTELSVRYGLFSRTLELIRGEALFNVAPGKWRPFEVIAGGGRIRDLGTRFDVVLSEKANRITVLDGVVKLKLADNGEKRRAKAGQTLTYNALSILSEPGKADLDIALAWQHGKLIFRNEPLERVLAEMERYHSVRFVIAGNGLKLKPISGIFESADLEQFLATLEIVLSAQIRRIDEHTIAIKRSGYR
ncbi:MAG: FecR family protein, partial [Gammaproteobacteria bacterium]